MGTKECSASVIGFLFLTVLSLFFLWILGDAPIRHAIGFPLDDAWIHMVYAKNLRLHGFFAFNEGIPATGETSPLWAMCLALLQAMFSKHPWTTQVIAIDIFNAIIYFICVILMWRMGFEYTQNDLAGKVAGLLLLCCSPFLAATFSGMEVVLASCLLLLTVYFFLKRSWMLSGLILALACVTRPEAAIAGVIFMVISNIADRKSSLSIVLRLLIFPMLFGGAWFLYNDVITHHLLPATFYFKQRMVWQELPTRLLFIFRHVILSIPPFIGGIGLFSMLGYFLNKKISRGGWIVFALGWGYVLTNVFIVQPDISSFYYTRYLFPAIPLLILSSVIGMNALGHLFLERSSIGLYGLLIFGLLGGIGTMYQTSRGLHTEIAMIQHNQIAMGIWIAMHVPPGLWVAASDVGAIQYFSKHPVVDVVGLNTPDMIWDPKRFTETHPVAVLALLIPFWYQVSPETSSYTQVIKRFLQPSTLVPALSRQITQQWIVSCSGKSGDRVRLSFKKQNAAQFVRDFSVDCLPGRLV